VIHLKLNVMKTLYQLFLAILFTVPAFAQPLKPGDQLPAITIPNLMNASQTSIALQSLRGKVVVLDFWATWCIPCIQSFPKLGDLQKKFGDELQIIAVSDEAPERVAQFIKNRPVDIWFAAETSASSVLRQRFPYVALPHVVIIDKEGVIRAITRGEEVTSDVISQVIKGITPAVSYKNEVVADGEVFERVAPGEEHFSIKGFQEGVRGGRVQGQNSLTYINMHFPRIYLELYNMGYRRLRYENVDPSEQKASKETMYSLYIATKESDYPKMVEALKQKMNSEFAYKSRLARERDTVVIITKIGEPDTAMVKAANSTTRSSSNKSKVYACNQPLGEAIAHYLENFGLVDNIVLDETGDKTKVDVSFSWEIERDGAMDEFLKKLGLKIEKAVREYDVLVIYK